MKWSIIKKYLSELGSPSRDKSKPDKKTIEDRKNEEKNDMVMRQSKYSEITRFVTDIMAEITKEVEEAKKLKAIFLETGNRIASATILQSAAEAGYSKEDVFENGILIQRWFFKRENKL
jgi:hypothetical protein